MSSSTQTQASANDAQIRIIQGIEGIQGIQGFLMPMRCTDLPETMQFFIERLGFRLDAIFPADGPRTAILSHNGLTLRLGLDVREDEGIGTLNVLCDDPGQLPGETRELTAPNGAVVRLVHANPPMMLPPTR